MTMLSVGMFRQPLSNVILNSPQIHFEQKNLAAVFDGEVRGDQITGSLKIIGLNATFHLRRSKDEPLPYTQEEVRFRNGNLALARTLTLPLTRRANPAIVFTHGGGPDTRDLSRFYADQFARASELLHLSMTSEVLALRLLTWLIGGVQVSLTYLEML